MKKTIFLDIDGCILRHNGDQYTQIKKKPKALPGAIEKLREWELKEYKIILTTGRKESTREITERQLSKLGIIYDQLVMGLNRGERIIINDKKPNNDMTTASAIEIIRNEGLKNINI